VIELVKIKIRVFKFLMITQGDQPQSKKDKGCVLRNIGDSARGGSGVVFSFWLTSQVTTTIQPKINVSSENKSQSQVSRIKLLAAS